MFSTPAGPLVYRREPDRRLRQPHRCRQELYGVFSANNSPVNASFPNDVTYQRHANFTTNTLLANDAVTPVAVSIDPFFFRFGDLGVADDFCVRDWTDSATVHDSGVEPSTHAVAYATSDVWNQRSNVAPTFISDQPQNEDPQNDATRFAFGRMSRNATGVAATVDVEFLVRVLSRRVWYRQSLCQRCHDQRKLAAGDSSKIASTSWLLGPTTSTHLCLAVLKCIWLGGIPAEQSRLAPRPGAWT